MIPLELPHPFWRYASLFREVVLLDSAGGDARHARESFLAADPIAVFRSSRSDRRRRDAFGELRAMVAEHGRGFGWIGYEAAHLIEELPDTGEDPFEALPDLYFMFPKVLLRHDHATGKTYLLRGSVPDLTEAKEPVAEAALPVHFDAEVHGRQVERIQEHIRAGDAFEVCLTTQLRTPYAGSDWSLYERLRELNPAPFGAFVRTPEVSILSSSPERFLRLEPGGTAESRPIKGTAPRGATLEEDETLRRALAGSVKDCAEHDMIVDLVRNDLGRVCQFGTVRVEEHRTIERYAAVHQMVSTIRGELNPERDAIDLIRACFPGGSMTGAPKIEAMKIIDSLEPTIRGIYSGALGWIDENALDLSIVIRTIVLRNGIAHFGTGGAIVADSDPKMEYEEALHKARPLLTALGLLK